jgi:transposase
VIPALPGHGFLLNGNWPWPRWSGLQPEFVKCARTIRAHKDGIAAAVDLELSNGRLEGLNNKIRAMINRAYGFHTAEAALALIMLACGPVKLELPYHT